MAGVLHGANQQEAALLLNYTIIDNDYVNNANGTAIIFDEASGAFQETFPPTDRLLEVLETLVRGLHLYYTPVVGFLAVLCNLLGGVLVTREPLFLESTCHYILAILVSNSVYMLTVLHKWLNELEIYFYQIGGWCQFVSFAMQAADFTSTWNVVALCVDRFVAIRFPHAENRFCTVWRARLVIVAIQIVAVIVYLNISILYGVLHMGARRLCTGLPEFSSVFKVLNHMHSVVNCLLPSVTTLALTVAMVENKLHVASWVTCWARNSASVRGNPVNHASAREIEMDQDRPCLALICSFILLQLPLFLTNIYITVRTLSSASYHMSLKDFLWQQVFLYVKYTSFALNLVIMVCTRGGFRRRLSSQRCWRPLDSRARGASSRLPSAVGETNTDECHVHFLSESPQTLELLSP